MVASILGLLVMTALMLGWRFLIQPPGGLHARVPRQDGVAVLRPPRGQNLMLAGLALAPTLILLALLLTTERFTEADQSGLALGVALLAFGGAVTLSLLAAEFRQRLRVDGQQLESVFVLTRLTFRWSEVERIRWNPSSRWFFLVAARAWLWVPIDVDGIGDFAELALGALPPAVLAASAETRRALETLAGVTDPTSRTA